MKIVDLFSGAGGLTFGFYYKVSRNRFVRRENVEFVFANEYSERAVGAFRSNFPEINMINDDIKNLTDERLDELLADSEVDLIIGGPPCQSFSTVGQRQYDDRAKLSNEYLRILEKIRPKMFLFENVKGILSMREIFYKTDKNGDLIYQEVKRHRGATTYCKKEPIVDHYGKRVMDKLSEEFSRIGYTIIPKTLVAADYGVPQNRERVVIIGIRNDLHIDWKWPEGGKITRTIFEAISDLPPVGENQCVTQYDSEPMNPYQQLMRKGSKEITEHYCGEYGEKIRTVIKNVAEGEGHDEFNAKVDKGLIDEKYRLTSGYSNTYGRLERNKPSTTITNNLATPSGLRCIHYEQNRALTPREGARIQSFPDWFRFCGTRTDVTRQVGNAVPPLMAIALANSIEVVLNGDGENEMMKK